jgi:hypothetical protein
MMAKEEVNWLLLKSHFMLRQSQHERKSQMISTHLRSP